MTTFIRRTPEMIECPDLLPTRFIKSLYSLLDVVSFICLSINLLVIYCILFRSTHQMRFYKWHLLFHQIASLFGDLESSLLLKPILMLPFPMMYPEGVSRGLLPTKYLVPLSLWSVCFAMATVAELFAYRYVVVQHGGKFPKFIIFLLFIIFLTSFLPPIGFIISFDEDQNAVFDQLEQEYSCVNQSLRNVPGIIIYTPWKVVNRALPLVALDVIAFASGAFIIIRIIITALTNPRMSAHTVRLQKRLLLQLSLQTFIPVVVVCVPGLWMCIVCYFQIFGHTVVAPLLVFSLSIFSATGGIVLISMNRVYRELFTRPFAEVFKRKETTNIPKISISYF